MDSAAPAPVARRPRWLTLGDAAGLPRPGRIPSGERERESDILTRVRHESRPRSTARRDLQLRVWRFLWDSPRQLALLGASGYAGAIDVAGRRRITRYDACPLAVARALRKYSRHGL